MDLTSKKLLIVDDEPLFLQTTCQLLRKEGAECDTAVDTASALHWLETREYDLILADLNLPGNLNWELLQTGRQRWSHVPMIVITGVPSLPSAIESLRLGVTDYLLKPVAFPDLLASIERSLTSSSINKNSNAADNSQEETIIGDSPAMQEVMLRIDRIAGSAAQVIISGETGTGKELVARFIHQRSRNRDGLFRVVDCNSVAEDQLAEDLFGSYDPVQGAKTGLLEQHAGGTIFLDEVAELPLSLQRKLLRVVQYQEFIPYGSSTPQRVNVRLISSTQRIMEQEIAAGRFRNDLFYRLGVLSIRLPPLRQRGQDIILLAEHFLREIGNLDMQISSAAKQALLAYAWPGNVRELRNAIVRAATFAHSNLVDLHDLPNEICASRSTPTVTESRLSNPFPGQEEIDRSLQEKRLETERAYLMRLLEDSKGNVTHAAIRANMSRQGFHKLLKRHQISASDFRGS